MESSVRSRIEEFIVANYLFGDESRAPADEDDLLLTGIIDSTGVLELIEFLESEFGVPVPEQDTVPANLGSVANLVRYLSGRAVAGQQA